MLGIPLGLAVANATEWAFHKYVLHGLGIRVTLDVPDETAPRLPPAVGGERDAPR